MIMNTKEKGKQEEAVKKFYDAKRNVVELGYEVLKGEVIRDKVKNRR